MPLISISFCILSSDASSPPTVLGHGLAGRASLQAITTSGGKRGGGSWTQPPAWASCATPLLCTPGWQRDIFSPQRCPLGMGSSVALHPYSCPGIGLGAPPDPSPSRSVPDHPSPAPSATQQDQPGHRDPNCPGCQDPLPCSQPPNSNFRTAFEGPSPRKLPAALQAATSPSAAAFPVTQRETQRLGGCLGQ